MAMLGETNLDSGDRGGGGRGRGRGQVTMQRPPPPLGKGLGARLSAADIMKWGAATEEER